MPARVYVRDQAGRWFGVRSASEHGSAILYGRTNWINRQSVEVHTTISAHPFEAELPPGIYDVSVERGHEYRPVQHRVQAGVEPVRFELRRWVDMASRGWFSGDTHVHRNLEDLPNVVLAEDLNVAFPLVYWVTKAYAPPTAGDKNLSGDIPDQLIEVDPAHVIWPRNTEWEIFTVNGQRHTLGAVFALGHRSAPTQPAPPVRPIAELARMEGALLDLDKHNWPWSMALIPIMGIDLYPLANNHIWRTAFAFTNWATPAPSYMKLPAHALDGGESAWISFTFQNYYALLNCGFRLRPTAGTANGVHPVPLGFGRVYVRLPGGFTYRKWLAGLNAGRSFVTTGPMVLAQFNGQDPGERFAVAGAAPFKIRVSGSVLSQGPIRQIEVVVNGDVARTVEPRNAVKGDAIENGFDETVAFEQSGWVAVRCWEERAEGRTRYAHTAPVFVDWEGRSRPPKRVEAEFLANSVRAELERSAEVLDARSLEEYRGALARYEELVSIAE